MDVSDEAKKKAEAQPIAAKKKILDDANAEKKTNEDKYNKLKANYDAEVKKFPELDKVAKEAETAVAKAKTAAAKPVADLAAKEKDTTAKKTATTTAKKKSDDTIAQQQKPAETKLTAAKKGVIATTTAVMLLHERGRLSINDPVKKHLPEFTGGDGTVDAFLSRGFRLPHRRQSLGLKQARANPNTV